MQVSSVSRCTAASQPQGSGSLPGRGSVISGCCHVSHQSVFACMEPQKTHSSHVARHVQSMRAETREQNPELSIRTSVLDLLRSVLLYGSLYPPIPPAVPHTASTGSTWLVVPRHPATSGMVWWWQTQYTWSSTNALQLSANSPL